MEESYEKSLRSLATPRAAPAAYLEGDLPQVALCGGILEAGDAHDPRPPGPVTHDPTDRLSFRHLAVELVNPDDPGPAEGRHCSTLVAPARGDDAEALERDRDREEDDPKKNDQDTA